MHDAADAERAVVVGAADVLDALVTLAGDDPVGGHVAIPGPLPTGGVTETRLCGYGGLGYICEEERKCVMVIVMLSCSDIDL